MIVEETREADVLLQVDQLKCHFAQGGALLGRKLAPIRAVDGVSFSVRRGETLGLVGESGSGKTTLGKAILGLTRVTAGAIHFDGSDITRASHSRRRGLRRQIQMIFQDPHSSLSPRRRVEYLLNEPYTINRVQTSERYTTNEMLTSVELPASVARRFPHELSGGQARRVGIARALALRPKLIVADEPTAGLDVSTASSILNLMRQLQRDFGITWLLITHNLNTVAYVADRIAVMYLGQLVEVGDTADVFDDPAHPYTQALLAAISEPTPRQRQEHRLLVPGEIPSPSDPPSGCRFHTRCPHAERICTEVVPELVATDSERKVACHFWREIAAMPSLRTASKRLG